MTRIPPHNLEAEEALLGAMMLSRPALANGLELVGMGDFYKPAHQRIFEALVHLYGVGSSVDPVTVAAELDRRGALDMVGGRTQLLAIQASTPASANAQHYAGIVGLNAAARRAITVLDEALVKAWDGDALAALEVVENASEVVAPPLDSVAPPVGASVLAAEDHDVDWIIRGLLARHEEVLIVAEPGSGKTTLLNQIAVCSASGLHPWTRAQIPVCVVLVFDFQDSRGARGRGVQSLLRVAGNWYPGNRGEGDTLFYELRPQGADLTSRADQRWFEAKVNAVRPDIVIAGPLYNMVQGAPGRPKHSEETAQAAGKFVAELVVKYNCALLVEAHAPHGEELRVRGSKYWEDWAGWGFGLRASVQDGYRQFVLERFRGDRETGRQWPTKYVQGHPDHWPWEIPQGHLPKDPTGGNDSLFGSTTDDDIF